MEEKTDKTISKNLIFVSGKLEDDTIINNIFKRDDSNIISFDYNSHKKLIKEKIDHKTVDNFLCENDFNQIDLKSLEICKIWYKDKKIKTFLTYDEINLGWLLEFELYFFLLEKIKILYVLNKICISENPTKIFVTPNLSKFSEKIFPKIKHNVFQNSIYDKQIFRTDSYLIKYNLGPIHISFSLKRNYFFFLRKLYEIIVIPFFNLLFRRSVKKNSILLLDFNPVLYQTFFNKLKKLPKNPIIVNRRRQVIFDFNSFKIIKNSSFFIGTFEKFLKKQTKNQIKHNYQNILNQIDTKISNDFLNKYFIVDNINFGELIRDEFLELCKTRFKEAIYEIYASRDFLTKTTPKLILHHYAASLQEKIIITQARKFGTLDINFQHGCSPYSIDNWNSLNLFFGHYPIFPESKLLVWGDFSKNYAISVNFPKENILTCGSPRYDDFFKMKKIDHKISGSIILALGAISQINSKAQKIEVYENFEKLLGSVCTILSKINRPKIVKLHPNVSDYKSINPISIIKEIDPTIQIVSDMEVGNLLNSSDVVITLQPSTLILEANIFEKPVITLLADSQFKKSIDDEGISKIFNLSNLNEFENYLFKMLKNSSLRKEQIKKGNMFVDLYLRNQGNSSIFTFNMLHSILKNSK